MSLVNVESFRTRVIDGMKPGDDLALRRWVTVLEAMALENVTTKKWDFFGRWLVGTALTSAINYTHDAAIILATRPMEDR